VCQNFAVSIFSLISVLLKKTNKNMTATKVVKSSQTITPFAGISFINDEIFRCGFSKLIDK
jgi:hypothetical protein